MDYNLIRFKLSNTVSKTEKSVLPMTTITFLMGSTAVRSSLQPTAVTPGKCVLFLKIIINLNFYEMFTQKKK